MKVQVTKCDVCGKEANCIQLKMPRIVEYKSVLGEERTIKKQEYIATDICDDCMEKIASMFVVVQKG